MFIVYCMFVCYQPTPVSKDITRFVVGLECVNSPFKSAGWYVIILHLFLELAVLHLKGLDCGIYYLISILQCRREFVLFVVYTDGMVYLYNISSQGKYMKVYGTCLSESGFSSATYSEKFNMLFASAKPKSIPVSCKVNI